MDPVERRRYMVVKLAVTSRASHIGGTRGPQVEIEVEAASDARTEELIAAAGETAQALLFAMGCKAVPESTVETTLRATQ